MIFFDLLTIFGQVAPPAPSVESPAWQQTVEAVKVILWIIAALLAAASTGVGVLIGWFKLAVPGVARLIAAWKRDKEAKRARLFKKREAVQAIVTRMTLDAGAAEVDALRLVCDVGKAHSAVLFRLHNGTGAPKSTEAVKSTALREQVTGSHDPQSEGWVAEPVEAEYQAALAALVDKPGETVLIDGEALPPGPLKVRYEARRTPVTLITSAGEVDGYPTFIAAYFSSATKAGTSTAQHTLGVRAANIIRNHERGLVEKRLELKRLTAELTKTFDMEETEI